MAEDNTGKNEVIDLAAAIVKMRQSAARSLPLNEDTMRIATKWELVRETVYYDVHSAMFADLLIVLKNAQDEQDEPATAIESWLDAELRNKLAEIQKA